MSIYLKLVKALISTVEPNLSRHLYPLSNPAPKKKATTKYSIA